MTVLALIVREIVGMFIDDEFLAVAVLAVAGTAAALVFWIGAPQLVAGGLLLFGCIAVLVASALKAKGKTERHNAIQDSIATRA